MPAETEGVVGVSSLGSKSEKARYSNYGTGPNDVAAPGGNGTTGDCRRTASRPTAPADTGVSRTDLGWTPQPRAAQLRV